MDDLEQHPLSKMFPEMTLDDARRVEESIREHGLRDPITLYQGQVLDGWNRYQICISCGIEPKVETFEGTEDEALQFAIDKNYNRRHLVQSQKALLAAELANHQAGRAKQGARPLVTIAEAAQIMDVHPDSVKDARFVLKHAEPEVVEALRQGEISLSTASMWAGMTLEERQAVSDRARQSEEEWRANKLAAIEKKAKWLSKHGLRKPSDAVPGMRDMFVSHPAVKLFGLTVQLLKKYQLTEVEHAYMVETLKVLTTFLETWTPLPTKKETK